MDDLDVISHQLMIIIGIIMYVFGLIGNVLNICVFFQWSCSQKSSRKPSNGYRTSNSSLYLLASSISNLILIIYPLLTRIIFDGFKYSVTKQSVFIFCKFRYYLLHTFDLISLTCICMATFDRYLISSRKVRLRKLSPTRKRTKQIILLIICLFLFHSIPIGLFFNVSNNGECIIFSKRYLYYYLWIFQIFLHSLIPIIFLTIVCLLTFKQMNNVKRINSHGNLINSEKQFSRMLLLISLAIVLSSIPYCIEHIYYVMISNHRSSLIYLYHVICSILFYINPVTSFYIFYISTPNFRVQVQNLLFCQRNNQNQIIVVIARGSRS
jgi:hypothetical protein